ncbi:MraY family glycosyltransferase [Caminibacter pacificus]
MFYVCITVFSFLLTYVLMVIARKKNIMDIPNERSSHSVPTPRGGGLAIVIAFFLGVFYLYYKGEIPGNLLLALLSGLPIVIISLIDDIVSLSSKIRFLVQMCSTGLALYFLGGLEKLNFIIFEIEGVWLNVVAFFGVLWLINLYNFIDGIDGYAASEAIFVSLAAFILFRESIFLLLAAAVGGFLPFNWQKAKIFMGDVGSAFLGFVFGIFIVYTANKEISILYWLILLGLFWFDATFTLFRRIKNEEPFTKPHKKHAYQRIVQAGFSHQKTVIYAMVVNIVTFVVIYISKESEYLFYVFIIYLCLLYLLTKLIDYKRPFYASV